MSFDGKTMVTPNSNTNDSTRIDLGFPAPLRPRSTRAELPIASSIMPDASKYYVSNYLDSTITCISIVTGACKNDAGVGVDIKTICVSSCLALALGQPRGLPIMIQPAAQDSRHQAAYQFRRPSPRTANL